MMPKPVSTEPSWLESQLGICTPSPEQKLEIYCQNQHQVSVWVKRDDLLHPTISGNKWRKLQHALRHIDRTKVHQVISFGGGHSNHLHALSYCCQQLKLPLLAMVRGNYSNSLTPTLNDMINWGTQIEYVDKLTYQQKDQSAFLQKLRMRFPESVIIPEGGSQQQALTGISTMVCELQNSYDVIIAPVASGATLAGLINEQPKHGSDVIGIAVLKGQAYLEKLVERFVPQQSISSNSNFKRKTPNWHIEHDFHHGGYAKSPPDLVNFCQQFMQQTQIPIEPVYSGKLFFAIMQMIETNRFKPHQKILAIHTGGLQGARTNVDTHSNA
ncbi:1-aminocyclopropane-1-carboxylate deaminase/D-cysteine desulfhydrase [Aliiglaciecola litoralis]|uniref:Pyridoxal-phosphate dependent enzyme n=1 Tax=Aliiglaciecola litoralis TaxID=582857 RepID=A0ABN1LGE3_9ALTE